MKIRLVYFIFSIVSVSRDKEEERMNKNEHWAIEVCTYLLAYVKGRKGEFTVDGLYDNTVQCIYFILNALKSQKAISEDRGPCAALYNAYGKHMMMMMERDAFKLLEARRPRCLANAPVCGRYAVPIPLDVRALPSDTSDGEL